MRDLGGGDGPRPMADAARAKHREERFRLVFPFTQLNLTNPSVGSRTCRPRARQIFPQRTLAGTPAPASTCCRRAGCETCLK